MKKEIFLALRQAGVIAKREVIDYICSRDDAEDYLRKVLDAMAGGNRTLTMSVLKEIEEKMDALKSMGEDAGRGDDSNLVIRDKYDSPPHEARKNIAERISYMEGSPEIRVEVTGSVSKPGDISRDDWDEISVIRDCTREIRTMPNTNGFVSYFRHRFETLKNILIENNRDLMNRTTSISIIKQRAITEGECYVIGMVTEIRSSKSKKSKVLVLEDTEDTITVILSERNAEVLKVPIVEDIVIGVRGVLKNRERLGGGGDPVIFANQIYLPDIPRSNIKRVVAEARKNQGVGGPKVAFLGDTHIGSNKFLEKIWHSFVEKVNGHGLYNARDEDLFRTLKYVVIVGDVVDGIGIYPDQENELDITDIYGQYEAFGKILEEIPSHIRIIVIPGNHDAVRPSEPQPAFSKDINSLLPSNALCLSNPAWISFNGSRVLIYHGKGIDDFVSANIGLGYEDVIEIMKTMLKFRHLAPIYGKKTPLAPEPKDNLVIDMVPDVFVTGHVHKFGTDMYNGVSIINASTWQAQTEYQKGINFNPDPGKIAFYDIKTRKTEAFDLMA